MTVEAIVKLIDRYRADITYAATGDDPELWESVAAAALAMSRELGALDVRHSAPGEVRQLAAITELQAEVTSGLHAEWTNCVANGPTRVQGSCDSAQRGFDEQYAALVESLARWEAYR